MGEKHFNDSINQDSSMIENLQPPLKKIKMNSKELNKTEIFSIKQLKISNSNKRISIIIKKGDKIQKRITKLLKLINEDQEIFLMSSGDNIQKLFSIIEILKLKIKEIQPKKSFEQFNKLEKYETFNKKNEILQKKIKIPIFYSLIRKIGDDKEFSKWTRQII